MDQASRPYAAFAQLQMSPEQSSEAVRLPVALEELKDVAKEVQDVFRLAREVQEEQRRWREKSEQEEAERKERQELLKVAAQSPAETKATLNFKLPTGAGSTEKLELSLTCFDLYSKAYEQLVHKDRPFHLKVEGHGLQKQVDEATYHMSLESLGLMAGKTYSVVIST